MQNRLMVPNMPIKNIKKLFLFFLLGTGSGVRGWKPCAIASDAPLYRGRVPGVPDVLKRGCDKVPFI